MPSQPAAVCALLVVGCALWTHLCRAVTCQAALRITVASIFTAPLSGHRGMPRSSCPNHERHNGSGRPA